MSSPTGDSATAVDSPSLQQRLHRDAKVILSAVPAIYMSLYSTPMAEQWRPVPRPQTVLALAPMYHVNAFDEPPHGVAAETDGEAA